MTPQSTVRAVLFDMDGVVVDTQRMVTAFWQTLANAHGIVLAPEDFFRHVYGLPASHTLDVLFGVLDRSARADALALMYQAEVAGSYQEIPGARSLLRSLACLGIPAALVTSAEPIKVHAVFEALHLEGLFATVVTRSDIVRGKPDPEGYLLAASRLGKEPANCLVLEDALSGVEAATAAGCPTIGVTTREHSDALLRAGARAVVPDVRAVFPHSRSGKISLLVAGQPIFHLG